MRVTNQKSILLKLWSVFTLFGFGITILVFIFSGWGAGDWWYGWLLGILAILAYFLILLPIIKQLGGNQIAKASQAAIVIAGALACMVLAPVAYGATLDARGVHCEGIAGAAVTCAEKWSLWPFLILVVYQVGLVLLFVIISLILSDYLRRRKTRH